MQVELKCGRLKSPFAKLNGCQHQEENSELRVRTFFHQSFQVYHVYCNFFLGYICPITVNFGTLKDGNLLINIFASNNCFSDKNILQNLVDALSKIDDAFLTKS